MVIKFIVLLYMINLVLSLPDPGVYLDLDVENNPKNVVPEVHLVLDVDKSEETENTDVTAPITVTDTSIADPTTTPFECPEDEGFFQLPGTHKCYKLFDDSDRTWYQANEKCHQEGLLMATISDAHALELRKLLVNTFGDNGQYVWLDARFNGFQYEWNDGKLIANDDSLWYSGHPNLKPDYCLVLLNSAGNMDQNPLIAYWSASCLETNSRKALCERE